MEQSPSPEADSYSASQKKPNAKVLVLTKMNLVHTLYTSFQIRFNIFLSSTPISPKWSLPVIFMHVSYKLSNRIHR
jgi:hypothetical protein